VGLHQGSVLSQRMMELGKLDVVVPGKVNPNPAQVHIAHSFPVGTCHNFSEHVANQNENDIIYVSSNAVEHAQVTHHDRLMYIGHT